MGALALLLAANALAADPVPPTVAASTEPIEIEMTAVGDIRLDGPVGAIAAKRGVAAPSAAVKGLLAADIEFANLETPVTTRGAKTPKTWNFRAKPKDLKIVRAAGITVVNIANNHVWDYGRDGFEDTLKALRDGGWDFVGGGDDRDDAERARVFEFEFGSATLRVGILGLTSTHPDEAWAGPKKPGVAYSDYARLGEIVARAKKDCDALIVSFHGGTELAEDPNEIQKAVAHAVIDAGADAFLGHHPHVLQPVEVYKGKPIVYSLGNFLFVSPTPSTRASAVARLRLGAAGVSSIVFAPLDTNWGRPKPAGPELAAAARAALNKLGAFDAHPDLLKIEEAAP